MKKKFFKLSFLYLSGALLFVVFLFFLSRNTILNYVIEKNQKKIFNSSGYKLTLSSCSFNGVNKIETLALFIGKNENDTLLFVDSLSLDLSLGYLLLGKIRVTSFDINKGFLRYPEKSNPDKIQLPIQKRNSTVDLIAIENIFTYSKKYLPETIKIKSFNIHSFYSDKYFQTGIFAFKKNDSCITGQLKYVSENVANNYKFVGKWNDHDSLQFKLYDGERLWMQIPFAYSTKIKTDSLLVKLSYTTKTDTSKQVNVYLSCYNLSVLHPKLSTTNVQMNTAGLGLKFTISENEIEIDDSSVLDINGIRFLIAGKIQTLPKKKYSFKLNSDHWTADSFFTKLPVGLFKTVNTLKAEGKLNYTLFFEYASDQPENILFESELGKENFKITSFGKTQLLKLNSDFNYEVFEKGKNEKTLFLSNSNPEFTPLEQISPFMRSTVLTSEDGSFFYHQGFNPEAFRKSIITNIDKGRFARGGSTITMQLVKNIFLNREKTISRKLEEVLLVWLIERNRLVSKERMFEIYLNIIEWGPGVYGVKEAADFYFKKKPSQLTLSESIFMASVIPHPKYFKYCFDTTGNFKSYMLDYYKVCSEFMRKKQLITEEEFLNLKAEVKLTGPARLYISAKIDEKEVEIEEEVF